MRRSIGWAIVIAGLVASPASAAVTANRDAQVVASTLGTGLSGSFEAIPPLKNSSNYDTFPVATAVDDPAAGFPTQGNGYAILSNGDAPSLKTYAGAGPDALTGGNVRGNTDFDVTILKVAFTAPGDANCLSFDFRMLSREYPTFVGGQFNDAFIAELDKTSWTTKDSAITAPDNFAFDPAGKVISINAAGETSMSKAEAQGTTYDQNGATPLLHAYTPVTPGPHTLYLSIFDQKDGSYTSTVLVDNVVAKNVPGGCAKGAVQGGPKPPPAPALTPAPTPAPVAEPPAPAVFATPPIFGKQGVVQLASNKKCVSRRKFRMRIKEKPGFEIALATVFVDGKRTTTLRQRIFGRERVTATVDLRGLPRGTFKVKIVVVSGDGRVLTGKRKYRTCGLKGKRNRGPL